MATEPTETVYTVSIIGVAPEKLADVADALAKIIRNYTRDQIVERLGRPPWTITKKAGAGTAGRLVKMLEPCGALLRVDPPLPAAGSSVRLPPPITPGSPVPASRPEPPEPPRNRSFAGAPISSPRPPWTPDRTPGQAPMTKPSAPLIESEWSIEPLSLGGILDRSFQICKVYWPKLLLIAAIPWAVITAMGIILVIVLGPLAMFGGMHRGPGAAPSGAFIVVAVLLGLVAVAVWTGVISLAHGAVTYAVSRIYLGRTVDVKGSLGFAYNRLGALVLTGFLVGVMSLLSFVAPMVVGGVLFGLVSAVGISGWWSAITWIPLLMVPMYCIPKMLLYDKAVILENQAYMDALKRSWDLLTGKATGEWPRSYFIRLIVLFHLLVIITMAIYMVVGLPAELISHFLPGSLRVIGTILAMILKNGSSLMGQLFGYVCMVVFYYDIRNRKEGFDLQMLAGIVEEP